MDQKFITLEGENPVLIAILKAKILQIQNETSIAQRILDAIPEYNQPFAVLFGLYVTQAYVSLSQNDIPMVQQYLEKSTKYRDLLDEDKDLYKSKWVKLWKGYLLHLQGIYFWRKGNDLESIKSYQQSISYNEETENLIPLSGSYNNLANVFR